MDDGKPSKLTVKCSSITAIIQSEIVSTAMVRSIARGMKKATMIDTRTSAESSKLNSVHTYPALNVSNNDIYRLFWTDNTQIIFEYFTLSEMLSYWNL